jgi:hypothetical protein
MSAVISLVWLASNIILLYSMYHNLSGDAREWVDQFAKIALTLTVFVVIVASISYLIEYVTK